MSMRGKSSMKVDINSICRKEINQRKTVHSLHSRRMSACDTKLISNKHVGLQNYYVCPEYVLKSEKTKNYNTLRTFLYWVSSIICIWFTSKYCALGCVLFLCVCHRKLLYKGTYVFFYVVPRRTAGKAAYKMIFWSSKSPQKDPSPQPARRREFSAVGFEIVISL